MAFFSIVAIVMPKQNGSHASKYFFAATADLKHIYRLVQLSEERATCPAVLSFPVAVKTNERLHLTLPDSGGTASQILILRAGRPPPPLPAGGGDDRVGVWPLYVLRLLSRFLP